MNRIYVDADEIPRGYSACKVFENEDYSMSTGSGNSNDDDDNRPVVIIDLKKLDISVIGGKSFLDHLNQGLSGYVLTLTYLATEEPTAFAATISQMFEMRYKAGVEEGRHQKTDELRKALEIY